MPRPCLICLSSAKSAKAVQMIAAGISDQATANALNALTPDGQPLSAMAVSRHRRLHVFAPAQAVAEMADKDRAIRQQREQQLAAAEAGDPRAFIALAAIVADLRRVHERLDAAAEQAAEASQHGGHAALAGQILRGVELRGRWGGHDKPAPTGNEAAQSFSVQIVFSGGAVERISTVPGGAIDAELDGTAARRQHCS